MIIQGSAGALSQTAVASGNPNTPAGARAELIVSELRGKYANAALAGFLFTAQVAAVTVPQQANNLVSVFSLLNPVASTKILELVSFDLAFVLATTVVNGWGLYYQANIGKGTSIPTSQTPIQTVANCFIGSANAPVALALSAATHVGQPALLVLLAYTGAVTSTAAAPIHTDFDGKYQMAAGSVVSLAATTAAGTGSGTTAAVTWAEF